MIPNKVILHTMTSIRLAGEVVNYLSREAWEQFRRQNRVTAFFEKKENEDSARVYRETLTTKLLTGSHFQDGIRYMVLA